MNIMRNGAVSPRSPVDNFCYLLLCESGGQKAVRKVQKKDTSSCLDLREEF